jgi:hypothetical protein
MKRILAKTSLDKIFEKYSKEISAGIIGCFQKEIIPILNRIEGKIAKINSVSKNHKRIKSLEIAPRLAA